MLYYTSTRDHTVEITSAEAMIRGIAENGGLFVPKVFPKFDLDFQKMCGLSYQELSVFVMRKFFTDFTEEELNDCVNNAYNHEKFDEGIVGFHECDGQTYLELYHGRTIAFKDMALSILPYLMKTAAEKLKVKEKIVILTATSGDTGKAALEGFADVDGVCIIVFYPKGGVSRIQELQMQTQKGANVHVIGVHGNFDDAQSSVKQLLSDEGLKADLKKRGYLFSSANSINIGRLVPQIVYYVYSYLYLLKNQLIKDGERINITVPTGNFGNILAAYYAKEMGLPVNKLICASNTNHVLTDFFTQGKYDKNRSFHITNSPSMDILVSSNLERLLYHLSGEDSEYVRTCMRKLASKGVYLANDKVKAAFSDFAAGFASQEETLLEIRRVFEECSGYVIDTHTAVASYVYRKYRETNQDTSYNITASTASCYKFLRDVYSSLDSTYDKDTDDFVLAERLSERTGLPIPGALSNLKSAPVLHNRVIEKENIAGTVLDILSVS